MLPSCKAQAWVQGALPPRGRHTHRGCSAVDYRGQAEQGAVSIIDCWVHQAIGNERHVTTQLGIILKVVLQHMDSTWTRGAGKEGQSRAEQSKVVSMSSDSSWCYCTGGLAAWWWLNHYAKT